jgi:hypothetical protein
LQKTQKQETAKAPREIFPSCNGSKRARWLAREGKMISFFIFAERSSTIECYYQPPHTPNLETIANKQACFIKQKILSNKEKTIQATTLLTHYYVHWHIPHT